MYMPALATIIVQKMVRKKPVIEPLQVRLHFNWWWVIAWLLPFLIAIFAFGLGLLFPGVEYSPDLAGLLARFESSVDPQQLEQMRRQLESASGTLFWIVLAQGLVAGLTINALAAFGEELGWRGLLLTAWKDWGFWRVSLATGLIWGIWHAPLILRGHNYPQHPQVGVIMMIAFTTLLSPLLTYVRLRAQSVVAAALMHGSVNASYGLSILLLKGGNDVTVGTTGLAGFVALIAANLLILYHDRSSETPVAELLSRRGDKQSS